MKLTRPILLMLILCILAIGLVMGIGIRVDRVTRQEIITRFSQRQLLLAEQTASGIQAALDEAQRDLLQIQTACASVNLVATLTEGDEAQIAASRAVAGQDWLSYLNTHPIYTQIRYLDLNGQEIVGVDRDGETVRVIPPDQLRSQAEREFFVAAMQLAAGQIYVSPPELARGHGGVGDGILTVRLATPALGNRGERVGVVVLNLAGEEIRAHVIRLSTAGEMDAWLMDERGIEIVNATNPEWEGQNAYEYCRQTGDQALISLTEEMLAGGRGTGIYFWPDGAGGSEVKKLLAYAPIHPTTGHVWSLGVAATFDSILAAHSQTSATVMLLGGSIISIILLMLTFALHSVHKQSVVEEKARRGEEMEMLQKISLVLTSQLELHELLRDVVEQGCRLLDIPGGAVYLVDDEQGNLELIVSHGYTRDYTGVRLPPGTGVGGRVLQSGAALIVDDYRNWERKSPDWEPELLTAVLGVPLKRGERVIGVIEFSASNRDKRFDEHDLWLTTIFANQAAVAIENARLYERMRQEINERKQAEDELERRVAQLALIYQVGLQVSSELELPPLLSEIVTAVRDAFGYYSVMLLLREEDDERLTLQSIAGEYAAVFSPDLSLPIGEGMIGHAAVTGETQVSGDVSQNQHYVRKAGEETKSEIAVPIQGKDRVIGILDIQSDELDAFDASDVAAMETLSTQIAAAIENARLYEQRWQEIAERRQVEETLRRRAAQLALINDVGKQIAAVLDLDSVLERTARLVQESFGYHHVGLFTLDRERDQVVMRAKAGEFAHMFPPDHRLKLDQGMVGWVAGHGQTLLANDVNTALHYTNLYPDILPTGAELSVPIAVSGEVVGVLDVQSPHPNAFDESDVMTLETLADQIAAAIENARLYERTQREIAERRQVEETLRRRAAQLALINDVGKQIAAVLDLDSVLERTARLVQESFGYHHVGLFTLDRERDQVVMRAKAGEFAHMFPPDHRLKLDQGMVGWVAGHGQTLLANDVNTAPHYTNLYPDILPTGAEMSVPIAVSGEVVGVLDVQSPRPNAFDESDVMTLETLADQIAAAIENARLYEEIERELTERKQAEEALARYNRELELLTRASQAFSSTLDQDRVFSAILEETRHLLGVTACSIWLVEPGSDDLVCLHSIGPRSDVVRGWRLAQGEGFAGWVAQNGKSLIVPDAQTDERYFKGVDELTGLSLRSILNVPLRTEQGVTGVLQVMDTQAGSFDSADLKLVEPLAASAAIAIENARLHSQVLDYAGQLEQRVQERTAQLESQYARLEAILHGVSDGIVVASRRGDMILANPIAQSWLDRTLLPEDAARLREAIRDLAQRADERPESVLELNGLDLELKAAPVVEGETKPGAAVVAVHDISHLKALDRVKTRFVSNVSHELRTPITTIKLYAALMHRQPDKWEQYLDTLITEADHQAQLVEDILQISRIDTGRLEMKLRPISLDELVETTVANRRALAESEGVTLECHPSQPEIMVQVDPERMMQVLNNLVENAIHYTPDGGMVQVSLGTEQAEGRTWATVRVVDTGMGIPEEELPHIFERFFRGEEPRTMQISGTGLGLAIVKEIVELHGGRVTVESKVDAGSTFTVWLPFSREWDAGY